MFFIETKYRLSHYQDEADWTQIDPISCCLKCQGFKPTTFWRSHFYLDDCKLKLFNFCQKVFFIEVYGGSLKNHFVKKLKNSWEIFHLSAPYFFCIGQPSSEKSQKSKRTISEFQKSAIFNQILTLDNAKKISFQSS